MFAQRLRLARKKAGLSMRDLAGRLSPPLSAQAISKYEGERMMPSSAVLVNLGRTLDVSLDFLMGGQVEALEGIEFRKHSGTSAKDRARAEAIVTEALEDYLAIEDILELEPRVDPFAGLWCNRIESFDEVEDKAGELRKHWNLGADPIPSVTGLLEGHGIKVIEADLPARFDGLACGVRRSGNRPEINAVVTSRRTTVERRRLTLAHELGAPGDSGYRQSGRQAREGHAAVRRGLSRARRPSPRAGRRVSAGRDLPRAAATQALLRRIGERDAHPPAGCRHPAPGRRRVRLPDLRAILAHPRTGTDCPWSGTGAGLRGHRGSSSSCGAPWETS